MPLPTPDWNLSIARNSALGFFTVNTLLLNEQVGYEYDTRKFKLGDGVTPWNLLEYAIGQPGSSIFLGLSADADNVLDISPVDNGFTLKDGDLSSLAVFDQALAGTVTDLTDFTTSNTRKASAVKAGILLRQIILSLGAGYADLLTGEMPLTTLAQAMAALQTQITTLSNDALQIDDLSTAGATTWSSTQIASEISDALAALVGAAPGTLNTLAELASSLGNNANLATTIASELANCVKFTVQSLTLAQQLQARANIGIDSYFGGVTYVSKNAAYTTQHKDGILADTTSGAFLVNLPAAPTLGTQVYLMDGADFSVNNLTVGANGSTIESAAGDIVLATKGLSLMFIYTAATWKVYTQVSGVITSLVTSINGVGGALTMKTVGGKSLLGAGDISGGLVATPIKSTAYAAIANDLVRLDSTGGVFTVNLPSAPADGDMVGFLDVMNQCGNYAVLLAATGGKTVEGDSVGLSIDISGACGSLLYNQATANWKLYATPRQASGILGIQYGGTGSDTASQARAALGAQAALVSGTNIKTVNNQALVGTGNIDVGDVTLLGVQSLANKTITETVYDITGTTPAIIAVNGAVQTWVLSGASTPTIGLTSGQSVLLMITPGAHAITWPTMIWTKVGGSGAAPSLFSAGKTNAVLWKVGAVLYGSHLGDTV